MGEDPSEIREEIEETRARMGETIEAIGYKTDVKTRAKESVSQKVGTVKSKLTGAGDRVSEATPSSDDVKQTARQAVGVAQENPIGLGIGAFAGGFLLGMLFPTTRVEEEKVAPVATEVRERAMSTAQEAIEHGKEVAKDAAQAAADTAKQEGQQHAQQVKEHAQQQAQEVRS